MVNMQGQPLYGARCIFRSVGGGANVYEDASDPLPSTIACLRLLAALRFSRYLLSPRISKKVSAAWQHRLTFLAGGIPCWFAATRPNRVQEHTAAACTCPLRNHCRCC